MSAQPNVYLTPAEYLASERQSTQRHEYQAGQVFALDGGSQQHNLIVTNIVAELRTQLRKSPCTVYPSDMQVKAHQTGLYTYPDVIVVCDEALFEDVDRDTLLNPTVLVEVLSKSTENYDRGKKFQHYRTLESFKEYLLIAQETHHVEHYARQPDEQWLLSDAGNDSLALHRLYAAVSRCL